MGLFNRKNNATVTIEVKPDRYVADSFDYQPEWATHTMRIHAILDTQTGERVTKGAGGALMTSNTERQAEEHAAHMSWLDRNA